VSLHAAGSALQSSRRVVWPAAWLGARLRFTTAASRRPAPAGGAARAERPPAVGGRRRPGARRRLPRIGRLRRPQARRGLCWGAGAQRLLLSSQLLLPTAAGRPERALELCRARARRRAARPRLRRPRGPRQRHAARQVPKRARDALGQGAHLHHAVEVGHAPPREVHAERDARRAGPQVGGEGADARQLALKARQPPQQRPVGALVGAVRLRQGRRGRMGG
jgi:hypothetical protein